MASQVELPVRGKNTELTWCVNIVVSEEKTTESDAKKFKKPGTANVLCQVV